MICGNIVYRIIRVHTHTHTHTHTNISTCRYKKTNNRTNIKHQKDLCANARKQERLSTVFWAIGGGHTLDDKLAKALLSKTVVKKKP